MISSGDSLVETDPKEPEVVKKGGAGRCLPSTGADRLPVTRRRDGDRNKLFLRLVECGWMVLETIQAPETHSLLPTGDEERHLRCGWPSDYQLLANVYHSIESHG
jgi:hypothetical protein